MTPMETNQGILPIEVTNAKRLAGILSMLNLVDNKPGVCEVSQEDRQIVRRHIEELNEVKGEWVF